MSQAPHILGIRHHSPACARMVSARIRELRPAFVLIEGPADFNGRLTELDLPHHLPIAIYSYLSTETLHHGSWSPLAEHSPEWQAFRTGRELGAQVRFIDLPAWHEAFASLENRYADVADAEHEALANAFEQALAERLSVQGRDALWDHLFEDGEAGGELQERLTAYFARLRGDDPGSLGNQAREKMMSAWIAWAMAQGQGEVLVVCGGYHAPALERLWSKMPTELPETPTPAFLHPMDEPDELDEKIDSGSPPRFGSYLVPYTFKRLDAFAGYSSGMPSPSWYQWVWEHGEEAPRHALRKIRKRLREKNLPASTADFIAVHLRAQGLARLRGHTRPLRCDWLDALAGALVKDALEAPLPWSYRGTLRPGTDPVLVLAMDVLAGDTAGRLAPGTPQPPLVQAVADELATLNIALPGTTQLDLYKPEDRARSRVLHRLAILRIPGITRTAGPKLALSGGRAESWQLSQPLEQHSALIEAGSWGATLLDAARACLESDLRHTQGQIVPLVEGLNRAAWAGLSALSAALVDELGQAIANEQHFESLAPALGSLHTLLRHGQALDMAEAPVLHTIIEAGFDRALWLLEPAATVTQAATHIEGFRALRQIVADTAAGISEGKPLSIEPVRALAVWQRKAADPASAPVSRGAALGAVMSLADRLPTQTSTVTHALQLLQTLPAPVLGDALSGLLALAREALLSETAFAAGMDSTLQSLDNADFVGALPSLRGAFAWLPPQERGSLAEQILALHGAPHLSHRVLTSRLQGDSTPEDVAAAQLAEDAAVRRLALWGIHCAEPEYPPGKILDVFDSVTELRTLPGNVKTIGRKPQSGRKAMKSSVPCDLVLLAPRKPI